MTKPYHVVGIGNALVDVLAHTEEDFLDSHGVQKGIMQLIDMERAVHLYEKVGPAQEISGGSAANTIAGIAHLGGRTAYVGKVKDDQLGAIFAHDLRAQGADYDTPKAPKETGAETGRCIVLVTPDGERSMNTYLGACVELGPEDIEEDKVAGSRVTFFEGYLWDPPRAKDAIRKASEIAHANGREMSMTLSDPFCVDRYRDEFLDLMRSGTVDIVFANEDEAKSLYQTADFETAIAAMREDCKLAIVTRSEKGSVAMRGNETASVSAHEINELVDSTGAGDLYAAGFLFGYTAGRSLEDCAHLGSIAAAIVIQQIGPRPQVSLRQAAIDAGLLKG